MKASTRRKVEKMTSLVFTFLGMLLGIFLSAWSFMLTIGVMHHDWWPVIPTVSYGASLLIVGIPAFFAAILLRIVRFLLSQ